VLAVVGIASRLNAGIITVPPGLSPGSQYQLVFFTSGGTMAVSSPNISDDNAFVTTMANNVPALAALGASWRAIGSTSATSALTNIGSSTDGIYNLNGNLVANGTAGLFSGSLFAPIDIDELGDVANVVVFTGSNSDGTSYPYNGLGGPLGPYDWVENGDSGSTTNSWITGSQVDPSRGGILYAISSPITVILLIEPDNTFLKSSKRHTRAAGIASRSDGGIEQRVSQAHSRQTAPRIN